MDVLGAQGITGNRVYDAATSFGHRSRFNLDDAFNDGDDNDDSLDFSPAAIRKELAKNMNHDQWGAMPDLDDFSSKIGYAVDDPDASVSTFDIDASLHDEPISPPTQQPPSPVSRTMSYISHSASLNDSQLASEFISVSLSDHHIPPTGPEEPEPEPEPETEPEVLPEQTEQYAEYPAVQIDVSAEHPVAEVVSPKSVANSVYYTAPDAGAIAQQNGESVQSAPSDPIPVSPTSHRSESSLPMPTSLSLPSPTPHHTNASTSSLGTRHRPTKSLGPSALDKVISKTRPHFLPPKNKKEDRKHMADWEAMMRKSRAAEDKRRKALQERRMSRERRIEESIHIWEREIVPNWQIVLKDPRLRRVWWQGIPTKLRATMWQNAVGNDLALSKDAYKACLSRAKRALSSGTFPTTILGFIDEDIKTTLPSLHLFAPETGPMYEDLKDLLCAWVVARSDEGQGYVAGVAKIGAMLLLNMPSTQAFLVMRNLLERHCMRSFYGGYTSKDDVQAYYRIFDTLLADGMPKIYFNFKQHQVSPAAYLPDWILSLFLDHLPFEACARLWDVLLLEGDSFLYRAALAILAVLEPRLFFPDSRELLELLRGENKAALEVAKRDGRPLNGGKYEIYGVDEESLWERIDSMDEWWKESTWTRLIQRELPDL